MGEKAVREVGSAKADEEKLHAADTKPTAEAEAAAAAGDAKAKARAVAFAKAKQDASTRAAAAAIATAEEAHAATIVATKPDDAMTGAIPNHLQFPF